MPLRVSKQQSDQAGINFVVAELNRRGIFASILDNNLHKNIDIVASNSNQTRTVMITVKTRRRGVWCASANDGKPSKKYLRKLNFGYLSVLRKLTNFRIIILFPNGGSETIFIMKLKRSH